MDGPQTDTPYRQEPNLGEDKGGLLGPKKDKYKVCSLVHKAPIKSLCLILGPSHENHNLFRMDLKHTLVYLNDSKMFLMIYARTITVQD